MFFKQQECTGRWISVESEAVCKTAKIQREMTYFLRDGCSTRGHTVCHGSQYKLESRSEMYCAWKAHQDNQSPPPVQIQSQLQNSKRRASKVSLSTACPFHLFLTLVRQNPLGLGSTRWLQALWLINRITGVSEGRQCNAKWYLKRFSDSSLPDLSCKPHTTWLCNGEQSTGRHCHEELLARATATGWRCPGPRNLLLSQAENIREKTQAWNTDFESP